MITLVSRIRSTAFSMTLASVIGITMAPVAANAGFFENLFGAPAPEAPPSYTYNAPADDGIVPTRPVYHAHKQVADNSKPVLQKTTDIWHDKTLRSGDAVMMRDGLHVYVGPSGNEARVRDLPRLDVAEVTKKSRAILLAMDTTRNEALQSGAAPDTIASGRSAAVASAVVDGYRITDAKGHSIRYVGP